MKLNRKIIKIDPEKCDGCGLCVPSCAEGAIQVVNGKARLVAEKLCDGLGACLGECPQGALQILEREAEAFDHDAVDEHLHSLKPVGIKQEPLMACGCPSTLIQSFQPRTPCEKANVPASYGDNASSLSHWPVQIHLVPPHAPFLKDADLLVAADCVPVAYPSFHRDFLQGRAVMIGCPKFDDGQAYVEKFAQIFAGNEVKSVTAVVMEVPCCQGLPVMIAKAMALAGKRIPLRNVVIGTRGQILRDEI